MKIRSSIPIWKRKSKLISLSPIKEDLELLSSTIAPTGIDPTLFVNTDKFNELDAIYKNSKSYLENDEHEEFWDIFKGFFKQDLSYKEQIARALMPKSNDEMIPEEKLQVLIEIQGFFSNFRIRMLEDLAVKLTHIYEQSTFLYQQGNLTDAGKLAQKASSIFRFFTVRLQEFEAPMDHYKGAMHFECTTALQVVQESGENNLKSMVDSVILKEREIEEGKN